MCGVNMNAFLMNNKGSPTTMNWDPVAARNRIRGRIAEARDALAAQRLEPPIPHFPRATLQEMLGGDDLLATVEIVADAVCGGCPVSKILEQPPNQRLNYCGLPPSYSIPTFAQGTDGDTRVQVVFRNVVAGQKWKWECQLVDQFQRPLPVAKLECTISIPKVRDLGQEIRMQVFPSANHDVSDLIAEHVPLTKPLISVRGRISGIPQVCDFQNDSWENVGSRELPVADLDFKWKRNTTTGASILEIRDDTASSIRIENWPY